MKLSLRLLLFPALVCMLAFAGCSGKGDDPKPTGHRIKYKAEVSSGAKITTIVYLAANGQETTVGGLNVTSWESQELNLPASALAVSFGAVGTAVDAAQNMKIQIIVDGVVKKESTAAGGTVLSASATYTF